MSLIQRAEKDLKRMIENQNDFGWPIILIDPDGKKLENIPDGSPFLALCDDISSLIDADTGDPVSGQLITISLRISTLLDNDFDLPKAISDKTKKPWLIQFKNVNGSGGIYKVSRSEPDRMAGIVFLVLEHYRKTKAF